MMIFHRPLRNRIINRNKVLILKRLWMTHLIWYLNQETNSLIKVFNKIQAVLQEQEMAKQFPMREIVSYNTLN